jgi:L-ascorbate metabolism protein UlaG (beta-lactamase superfamily)
MIATERLKILSVSVFLVVVALAVPGCAGPATSSIPTVGSPSPASNTSAVAQLQWLGHSTFLITSSQGTRILIDPLNAATGYSVTPINGVDAVLISHEHSDHNNSAMALGNPLIIRGLNSTGWNVIDQKVKDIRVRSISPVNPVYHDNLNGSQRGRNTIFVVEVDGLRIAHLGDLGHVLTPAIAQTIGVLDAVLVPVGGSYTIDATAATEVVSQLNPRLAIPMHYKTPKMQANWPGAGVEAFLDGKIVERPNSNVIRLSKTDLPAKTEVMVLNYE